MNASIKTYGLNPKGSDPGIIGSGRREPKKSDMFDEHDTHVIPGCLSNGLHKSPQGKPLRRSN